jgi:hypothetical protein
MGGTYLVLRGGAHNALCPCRQRGARIGKSRLLEVLELLVRRPWLAIRPSASTLLRDASLQLPPTGRTTRRWPLWPLLRLAEGGSVSDGYIGNESAHAPDLIEHVVGVRGFSRAGHMLASPFQGDEWRKPEQHARCSPSRPRTAAALARLGIKPKPAASTAAQLVQRQERLQPHRAPHEDCHCGLYAYHDTDTDFLEFHPITAIVQAWGLLQVHARGFRAEHLRVVALALGDIEPTVSGERYAEVARRACAWWKVPVLTREGLAASLSEFGSPVPEDLRPQEEESE